MPFTFKRVRELPDVVIVEPKRLGDDRGWFSEFYKKSDFASSGLEEDFPQDNHSRSTGRGVLRGLHYQRNPKAQGKLVRCVVGEIFDVAVDIRVGSPTYRKWHATVLSANDPRMVWVPPGFAHGFCTVSEVTEVIYKVTQEYSPAEDRGIRWNDPDIGVTWPVAEPILSPKDAAAPFLANADNNYVYAPMRVGDMT